MLAAAPGVRLIELPTPGAATQTQEVLVGRIRPDRSADGNGLVLFLACDNLRKGAALGVLAGVIVGFIARKLRSPRVAVAVGVAVAAVITGAWVLVRGIG